MLNCIVIVLYCNKPHKTIVSGGCSLRRVFSAVIDWPEITWAIFIYG